MKKLMNSKELPFGDAIEAGTAHEFNTGDWRSDKPIFNQQTCINCYQCWVYCPDSSIALDADKKVCGIDYDHCKGCGICAKVCPTKPKSIVMEQEAK